MSASVITVEAHKDLSHKLIYSAALLLGYLYRLASGKHPNASKFTKIVKSQLRMKHTPTLQDALAFVQRSEEKNRKVYVI